MRRVLAPRAELPLTCKDLGRQVTEEGPWRSDSTNSSGELWTAAKGPPTRRAEGGLREPSPDQSLPGRSVSETPRALAYKVIW